MYIPLPEGLLSAARTGRLNVLVGAGISMDAGLPSWTGLLRSMAGGLNVAHQRQIARLLDEERLLEAAQLLVEYMGRSDLHRSLESFLSRVDQPSVLHDLVWHLSPPAVFTTNFDALLENAYAKRFGRPPHVILGTEAVKLASARTHGRICKLHGDLRDPESIVFARNQYFGAIERVASIRGGMWGQFATTPCLAIGYSLRDPDLQLLLTWLTTSLRSYAQPFYLLTSEDREEELRLLRSVDCVVPIQYTATNGHREPLSWILRTLAAERASLDYVSSTSPAELALLRRVTSALATLLHDLVGNVAALNSNVDFISLEEGGQQDRAEAFADLQTSLQTLMANLRDGMELVRSPRDRLTPAKCAESVEALRRALEHRRYARVVCKAQELDGQAEIPIGVGLFIALVRLLVDNALDATFDLGDKAAVSVGIRMTNLSGRRHLIITVRDNGSGLADEVQAQLFSPGVSTKGEGRGNGLFLLRMICDECGGDVSVASTREEGTTMEFALPTSGDGRVAVSEVPTAAPSPQAASGRIPRLLVFDDDDTFLRAVARQLEAFGYQVSTESDSAKIMGVLAALEAPPDVFICDVVVAGPLSGITIVEAAWERYPELPVILMSGFADQRLATRLRAAKFLAKPFELSELRSVIDHMIGRSVSQVAGAQKFSRN